MSSRTATVIIIAVLGVLVLTTLGGDEESPSAPVITTTTGAAARPMARPRAPEAMRLAAPDRWQPTTDEEQPALKRAAARVVEALTRYDRDEGPKDVLARIPEATELSAGPATRALHQPGRVSVGTVRYPQLSGLTTTTAGAMVLVRQTTLDRAGRTRTVSRVIDVRLRLQNTRWVLDRIASTGGTPTKRPPMLSAAARRALDHPNLELSDSARWDIHRKVVDDALLRALARVADRRALSVLVLRTGHPTNVWATDRRSAHSDGLAADIHLVSGRLVAQRPVPPGALAAGRALLDGGAQQLGGPRDLAPGSRSFTDPVHADHLHVQQTPR